MSGAYAGGATSGAADVLHAHETIACTCTKAQLGTSSTCPDGEANSNAVAFSYQ